MIKAITTMDIKSQFAYMLMAFGSGMAWIIEFEWEFLLTAISVLAGAALALTQAGKNLAERKKKIEDKQKLAIELDNQIFAKRFELMNIQEKINEKKDEEH